MLTFKQYVSEKRDAARSKYGLTVAESIEELPASAYWAEWRDYVLDSFVSGDDIPTKMWRSFDEGLQYRILRSPRCLKDDALTHKLKGL